MKLRKVQASSDDRFAGIADHYEVVDVRAEDIGPPSKEFRAFVRSLPRPLRHDMGLRGLGWKLAFARQLRRRFVAQSSTEGPR